MEMAPGRCYWRKRGGTGQNVKRAAVIVRNTAANALATDQHIIELVAQSEPRYGRRFRMQDLDRAMASVRSRFAQRPSHRLEHLRRAELDVQLQIGAELRRPMCPLVSSAQTHHRSAEHRRTGAR
jgi:hypothetical protein